MPPGRGFHGRKSSSASKSSCCLSAVPQFLCLQSEPLNYLPQTNAFWSPRNPVEAEGLCAGVQRCSVDMHACEHKCPDNERRGPWLLGSLSPACLPGSLVRLFSVHGRASGQCPLCSVAQWVNTPQGPKKPDWSRSSPDSSCGFGRITLRGLWFWPL